MTGMQAESVDAIITYPPYELGFMGKKWDASGIAYNVELWQECLRVLKPGGHFIAFGGTRTYHRMAVAIEDAGFEVRDMLEWIYNSGFPKSLNVGKAVDKRSGVSISWFGKWLREWREKENIPQKEIAKLFPSKTGGLTGCVANWELGLNMPTNEQFNLICKTFNLPFDSLEEAEREVIGKDKNWGEKGVVPLTGYKEFDITKGNSEWEGFGSALKPAHEPIIMARKPLSEKTIVENVLKHGTGAIDIDGCRIPTREKTQSKGAKETSNNYGKISVEAEKDKYPMELDRFPANIICTDDALNDGVMTKSVSGGKSTGRNFGGASEKDMDRTGHSDSGSKSRYFDIDVWAEKHGLLQFPKASKRERNEGCERLEEKRITGQPSFLDEGGHAKATGKPNKAIYNQNHHPTVKPVHLISWLVRLVSKEGDTVLDPFAGSFTTGVACKMLGRKFIGIEMDESYVVIGKARIEAVKRLRQEVFDFRKEK